MFYAKITLNTVTNMNLTGDMQVKGNLIPSKEWLNQRT